MAEPMTSEVSHAWIPEDTFGARLALIRQAKGLNVKRAAEMVPDVSVESWRQWEHGRSPHQMDRVARRIADAFGVDYVWLLTGSRTGPRLTLLPSPDQAELPLDWGRTPFLTLAAS